jgi:hypothetical protein
VYSCAILVRAPAIFFTLSLLLAACRITNFAEVALPVEGAAKGSMFVVECNYELENCLERAARTCDGDFEQITRKNCPRCGELVPSHVQKPVYYPLPAYHGVLYFRCMRGPRGPK